MLEKFELQAMVKGWFIGDFEPTLFQTEDVEVAIKHYQAGESEATHYHKIATEFTVVLFGQIKMNGIIYSSNQIIKVNPGVSTDFEALTDVSTVVVKIPGAKNDKYNLNKF